MERRCARALCEVSSCHSMSELEGIIWLGDQRWVDICASSPGGGSVASVVVCTCTPVTLPIFFEAVTAMIIF